MVNYDYNLIIHTRKVSAEKLQQGKLLGKGIKPMKRILTIQDISCVGKCSLTIALPVISAMGVECAVLPTALLSNHTMFKSFTFDDLSDQISPIMECWKNEGITFDAIYTGYLGSVQDIDLVKKLIADFSNDETLVFIDPVMADNGKLYSNFDDTYVKANTSLCAAADVIVPNLTEACLLTDTPYREDMTIDEKKELLLKLCSLGSKTSVLTGVSMEEGKTGVLGFDSEKKEFFSVQSEHIDASFHGTGDIFSSVTVGALMNGLSWEQSLQIAADYTGATIKATLEDPKKPWYGVNFEQTIPQLINMLRDAG